MKNLSIIFNLVLPILSTQLFASTQAPAKFQNDIHGPLIVNSADIGVPTMPPITYQEKAYTLTFESNDAEQIPVDIRAVKIGNKVFLSIKAVRFNTTTGDFFSFFVGQLPETTFNPNDLTQLSYAPIIGEDVVTEYKRDSIGLVTISEGGQIVIYFTAPPSSDYWPQDETCGWNELTLVYTVLP